MADADSKAGLEPEPREKRWEKQAVYPGEGFTAPEYEPKGQLLDDTLPDTASLLMLAAAANHIVRVRKILDKRPTLVNYSDESGQTPLTLATLFGNIHIVRLLVERGATVDHVTNDGDTALMMSSTEGHRMLTRALVRRGADVTFFDESGDNPVHRAAAFGHADVVSDLVVRGGDVHRPDDLGYTPVMTATEFGYTGCITKLVQGGADANALSHEKNYALLRAKELRVKETEKYLVEQAGAKLQKIKRW